MSVLKGQKIMSLKIFPVSTTLTLFQVAVNCFHIYDWVNPHIYHIYEGVNGTSMPLWKRWLFFPAWSFDILTLTLLVEMAMLWARRLKEDKEGHNDGVWFR